MPAHHHTTACSPVMTENKRTDQQRTPPAAWHRPTDARHSSGRCGLVPGVRAAWYYDVRIATSYHRYTA